MVFLPTNELLDQAFVVSTYLSVFGTMTPGPHAPKDDIDKKMLPHIVPSRGFDTATILSTENTCCDSLASGSVAVGKHLPSRHVTIFIG